MDKIKDIKRLGPVLVLIAFFLHQSSVIFGVNLSISDFLILISFIYIFCVKKTKLNLIHLLVLFFLLAVYLINGCLIIPSKLSFDNSFTKIISEVFKLVILFFFFEHGVYLKDNKLFIQFIRVYSISAVIITVFCILTSVIKIQPFYDFIHLVTGRLNGLFNDPNYFAIAELTAIPFFVNKSSSKKAKLINTLVLIIGILLSGSKTGFLSLIIYLIFKCIIFIVFNHDLAIKKKIIVTALLSVLFIVTYVNIDKIIYYANIYFPSSKRVTGIISDLDSNISSSGSSRDIAWINGLNLIKKFPLLGVGKGNQSIVGLKLFSNGTISHNSFIQIFVDWGSIISLCFIIYILARCIYYFNIYKFVEYKNKIIEIDILLIFLIGSLGISLDNSRMLWLILGSVLYRENRKYI